MNFTFFVTYMLVCHWLGDFILQSKWMAENKAKSGDALLAHVLTYTGILAFAVLPLTVAGVFTIKSIALFVIGNGVIHLMIDSITAEHTAAAFKLKDWRKFFIILGFDQMLHAITLVVASSLLFVGNA